MYRKLLDKLEQVRQTLGGQVFDVLGKLHFEGRPLRELLVEAIRRSRLRYRLGLPPAFSRFSLGYA